MNTTTNMFFYKGTMFPITYKGDNFYGTLKELVDEMIVNELRGGATIPELVSCYKKQLDTIENELYLIGNQDNEKKINKGLEKMSKTLNQTPEEINAMWCSNIIALLKFKAIPNDDMNGYVGVRHS